MNPLGGTIYFVSLFFALAALLRWRYRRQDGPHRLRRGLRTYVSGSRIPAGEFKMAILER